MSATRLDGGGRYVFMPKEHFPNGEIPKNSHNTGVIQITPKEEGKFRIIAGLDNHCCDGVTIAYTLSLSPEPTVTNFCAVNTPFNSFGLLGAEDYALVSGSGCGGSGVRFVDFRDSSIRDVFSSGESDRYRGVMGSLFFEPPQMKDGELRVSFFDTQGRIIPEGRVSSSFEGRLRELHETNREIHRATEISIDDWVKRVLQDPETILENIKTTVARSRLIYNYHGMNRETLNGAMWELHDFSY